MQLKVNLNSLPQGSHYSVHDHIDILYLYGFFLSTYCMNDAEAWGLENSSLQSSVAS